MCEAYKQGMTQRQGYVWFLPGWYQFDWYDVDAMRQSGIDNEDQDDDEFMPNCTTRQMVEVTPLGDGRNGRLQVSGTHSVTSNDRERLLALRCPPGKVSRDISKVFFC